MIAYCSGRENPRRIKEPRIRSCLMLTVTRKIRAALCGRTVKDAMNGDVALDYVFLAEQNVNMAIPVGGGQPHACDDAVLANLRVGNGNQNFFGNFRKG